MAADGTVGPDSRAPSAGSILCMGWTIPHRLAVCWGPLRASQGATVERPHVMYSPDRGGAPRPGGLFAVCHHPGADPAQGDSFRLCRTHKKTSPPCHGGSRKDLGHTSCESAPRLTAWALESPISGCRGRHTTSYRHSCILSIAERGEAVKPLLHKNPKSDMFPGPRARHCSGARSAPALQWSSLGPGTAGKPGPRARPVRAGAGGLRGPGGHPRGGARALSGPSGRGQSGRGPLFGPRVLNSTKNSLFC